MQCKKNTILQSEFVVFLLLLLCIKALYQIKKSCMVGYSENHQIYCFGCVFFCFFNNVFFGFGLKCGPSPMLCMS